MALSIHRRPRTDLLAAGLAEVLTTPLTTLAGTQDPFLAEIVSVPTRGVERFLTQQLGQRLGVTAPGAGDGVCADVRFPAPTELLQDTMAEVLGAGTARFADDPWHPRRLTWTVLDLIRDDVDGTWKRAAQMHRTGSDAEGEGDRQLHVSRTVADLFQRYGIERPHLIADWAAGRDTDGFGAPVPEDLAWQPQLWRAARTRIGVASPAEAMFDACTRLADDPALTTLPARLSLFGPTRLPGAHRLLLATLAQARDVHLWVPDPSPHRWDAIAAAARVGHPAVPPLRRSSPVAVATRSPLLRSLGRDSGELAYLLTALDSGARQPDTESDGALQTPGPPPPPDRGESLLGVLQSVIAADLPVVDGAASLDGTVQLHDCHGRPRQVEVLRETILGLLAADPSLEPRDILIMCPDVSSFAPVITAAFSATDPHSDAPAAALRVRIADRTSAQSNDVLQALDHLLTMADDRFAASTVMDFTALPAVRARFGLDDDGIERLNDLVTRAGIRWGLDHSDRTRHGLPVEISQNTFRAGLERMLLGVALGDEDLQMSGAVLPVENVTGNDAALIATLAELVDRLRLITPQLREKHDVGDWTRLLSHSLECLTAGVGPNSWQVPAALGALSRLADESGGSTTPLHLKDVRLWLSDVLAGRPTRTNFRTGGVTVCSLQPMRSVPYRVICLLGLDDGVFPRRTTPDGDDLTARDPRVGERDPGAEDRQLFLDALMAATEHLVITYAGRNVRTNRPQPPAVPVGELLDTLSEITGLTSGELVVRHPLQPFDPANFRSGELVPDRPFSHDATALDGARALCEPRRPAPPLFTGTLAADPVAEVALSDLTAFLTHPPSFFLRHRLGLFLERDLTAPADQIPIELDGLQRWQVGDRVLTGLLRDGEYSRITRAEAYRGDLPPAGLARGAFVAIADHAQLIATQVLALRTEPVREVPVSLLLPSGVRLTGVVPFVSGNRLVEATYSSLKDKDILGLWVRTLALQASQPGSPIVSALAAKGSSGVNNWTFQAPEADSAVAELDLLVDLLARGRREPLPLMPEAARSYATRRARGNEPQSTLDAVAAEWTRNLTRPGSESNDRAVQRLWGENEHVPAPCCRHPAARRADVVPRGNQPFRGPCPPGVGFTAGPRIGGATTMVTPTEPFDLTGPLPTGTHLLEASAGTGKTYAIAALTTRYIAEGHATIDQLLLMTFGRAATQELRERVRSRLVDTYRAITRFQATGARSADDAIIAALCEGPADLVATRRARLGAAITGFDQASIETTHGFCQRTLEQLGIAADTDPLETFTEDLSSLTHDVVADLYLARYGTAGAPAPAFDLEQAGLIARGIVHDPMAEILTGDDDPHSPAGQRLSFAQAVRAEHLARRRRLGLTTYDDLLTRVDAALADPTTGPSARAMLRRQFPVVMVDEFQDTDPMQWDILRRAFHGAATLILIGDPKQAIYAFRGGDIDTYLQAAAVADHRSTLGTNMRTDGALVDRITRVFGDTQLGDAAITVRPVSAHHQQRRLVGGPDASPWRVRTLPDPGTGKPAGVAELRRQVAADVTEDIVALLSGDARLLTDGRDRHVQPGDVAVLVDTNKEADLIHQTLKGAGVNAVVTASENVFASPAAHHWLTVLRAMEKPQHAGLVRSAMITPFLGFTGRDLADGGDDVLDQGTQTVRSWSAQFRISGIAGVMHAMGPGMTRRILTQPQGERLFTDIRHVGEELHSMARTAGLAGLVEWLTGRITDSSTEAEESSRRLDTDAAAVQIVTVHRSKGLEFPITYVPFAWNRWIGTPERLLLHDEGGRRVTDVRGPTSPHWREHLHRHRLEDAGERLRLLYVALTRASCQVVLWWVRSNNTPASPLQRLIGARTNGAAAPDADYATNKIGLAEVEQILGPVTAADHVPAHRQDSPVGAPGGLAVAGYDRVVDALWRRTSYSALTASAHEAAYRGEDSPSGERDDEPTAPPAESHHPRAARRPPHRWQICRSERRSGSSPTGCTSCSTAQLPTTSRTCGGVRATPWGSALCPTSAPPTWRSGSCRAS